jgi:hypothetical protein
MSCKYLANFVAFSYQNKLIKIHTSYEPIKETLRLKTLHRRTRTGEFYSYQQTPSTYILDFESPLILEERHTLIDFLFNMKGKEFIFINSDAIRWKVRLINDPVVTKASRQRDTVAFALEGNRI